MTKQKATTSTSATDNTLSKQVTTCINQSRVSDVVKDALKSYEASAKYDADKERFTESTGIDARVLETFGKRLTASDKPTTTELANTIRVPSFDDLHVAYNGSLFTLSAELVTRHLEYALAKRARDNAGKAGTDKVGAMGDFLATVWEGYWSKIELKKARNPATTTTKRGTGATVAPVTCAQHESVLKKMLSPTDYEQLEAHITYMFESEKRWGKYVLVDAGVMKEKGYAWFTESYEKAHQDNVASAEKQEEKKQDSLFGDLDALSSLVSPTTKK